MAPIDRSRNLAPEGFGFENRAVGEHREVVRLHDVPRDDFRARVFAEPVEHTTRSDGLSPSPSTATRMRRTRVDPLRSGAPARDGAIEGLNEIDRHVTRRILASEQGGAFR